MSDRESEASGTRSRHGGWRTAAVLAAAAVPAVVAIVLGASAATPAVTSAKRAAIALGGGKPESGTPTAQPLRDATTTPPFRLLLAPRPMTVAAGGSGTFTATLTTRRAGVTVAVFHVADRPRGWEVSPNAGLLAVQHGAQRITVVVPKHASPGRYEIVLIALALDTQTPRSAVITVRVPAPGRP